MEDTYEKVDPNTLAVTKTISKEKLERRLVDCNNRLAEAIVEGEKERAKLQAQLDVLK